MKKLEIGLVFALCLVLWITEMMTAGFLPILLAGVSKRFWE